MHGDNAEELGTSLLKYSIKQTQQLAHTLGYIMASSIAFNTIINLIVIDFEASTNRK